MKSRRAPHAILGIVAVSAAALTGCSTAAPQEESGPVTIQVGDYPTPDQEAARAVFDARLEQFSELHPDITVEPIEQVWEAQTFQAGVAGGTLPTVLKVPFTEIQGLIARGQVADITTQLEDAGIAEQLNPQSATIAQDADGQQFGVPVNPYAIGLYYNRELFEQVGLDPNAPPTTWDEVVDYAATISEKTGKTGYAQMTTENTGGWMLTAQIYSMGGSVENDEGTEITFDDAAAAQALEYLRQMRWDDQSMGSNFLYNMADIGKDFGAGEIGMFLSAPSGSYGTVINTYGMDRSVVGIGPVPTGPGFDGEVLAGGSVEIVSPKATEAQKEAAVKWIEFADLSLYSDEDAAKEAAEASAADGGSVGIPRVSPVAPELYENYLEWVEEFINVPQENVQAYNDNLAEVELKAEPVTAAQDVYGILDSAIQKVLTEQDADIAQVLADAASAAQDKVDRASR
ncbi:extracellular solute-binding protein [Microbacterium sp. CIAB417]|uniref:extracellular solute-binding protein n=1 Tax=Microbacterium sp. CIAB417 TaxID=2860287 RepID=UPI001FABF900|nr:extracellular solute-binding protein [Microbacterium sp. CIAB417]